MPRRFVVGQGNGPEPNERCVRTTVAIALLFVRFGFVLGAIGVPAVHSIVIGVDDRTCAGGIGTPQVCGQCNTGAVNIPTSCTQCCETHGGATNAAYSSRDGVGG